MKVGTTLAAPLRMAPRQCVVSSGALADRVSVGDGAARFMAGVHLVGYGSIYKVQKAAGDLADAMRRPLSTQPVPIVRTPFVLVPGWKTKPGAFQPLMDYLTRDHANGGQAFFVRQGAFFTRDRRGELQPAAAVPADARVFAMVFSNNRQSPRHSVAEMRANMEAIRRVTGQGQLDVQAYSMGGLTTRLYLDTGGTAIRRCMMLGTPNRGTQLAALAKRTLDKNIGWARKFADVRAEDDEAIQWLMPEPHNPHLRDLNSRFAQQKGATPMLMVAADSRLTASSRNRYGLSRGDGQVESDRVGMPGCPLVMLHEARAHAQLNTDETVQHVRAVFFGWDVAADATAKFPQNETLLQQIPQPAPGPRVAGCVPWAEAWSRALES